MFHFRHHSFKFYVAIGVYKNVLALLYKCIQLMQYVGGEVKWFVLNIFQLMLLYVMSLHCAVHKYSILVYFDPHTIGAAENQAQQHHFNPTNRQRV